MLYQTKNPHGGDIYDKNIILDYSANTNPFGTPEGVKKAIIDSASQVDRYPDPYCRALTEAIADFEGVEKDHILVGSGSADLIYTFGRALSPSSAAELAPTFSEYSLGLTGTDCKMERFFLYKEDGFLPDSSLMDFLKDKQPEVLFLCNPNNPTGQLIPEALLLDVLDLCRRLNIRVFLDECFLDLTGLNVTMKAYLEKYPNLLILKAFTKSYGMAGVRLGYCLCADHELLMKMSELSQPWNVSTPAQKAGIAALKEQDFLKKALSVIGEERAFLAENLKALGFDVCPSCANYILFEAFETLGEELLNKGIMIRDCSNYYGLTKGWYRIAVRTREENEQLVNALEQI
ncbi:MAG: aminotransferase class I/II-fold pyridoxal phosphate-dependent enzyme, partial [Parasporobacterium sp.]|nr:aminotransferase class I/II-fold pyridoxal phosphate-dependent enzyme [Parasporobacterium sp.]